MSSAILSSHQSNTANAASTASEPPTPHAVAAGYIIGAIAGLMFVAAIFGVWQLFAASESGLDAAVSTQPK
jgi:hypothetical protein